jgi:hypothetical protein
MCVCVANKIYLRALREALPAQIAEVDCPEATLSMSPCCGANVIGSGGSRNE